MLAGLTAFRGTGDSFVTFQGYIVGVHWTYDLWVWFAALAMPACVNATINVWHSSLTKPIFRRFSLRVRWTDEQFSAFCAEHPDLFFEMTAQGEIIVLPPTPTLTGARNNKIVRQLEAWGERDGRGVTTGSSDGFLLPNGSRRSPDAAWTLKSRIAELPPESRSAFWHLSPDFVIELKSATDRLPVLRAKMAEWIANGAQLAWLIDADVRTIEVYRAGAAEPAIVSGVESIAGGAPLEGFELQLAPVWDPLA